MRDGAADMDYFAIGVKVVDTMWAQIDSPYFSMSPLKLYIVEMIDVWAAIRETVG